MITFIYLIFVAPFWTKFFENDFKPIEYWGRWHTIFPQNWWNEKRVSTLVKLGLTLTYFILEVSILNSVSNNVENHKGWHSAIFLPEFVGLIMIAINIIGWLGIAVLAAIGFIISSVINFIEKQDEKIRNKK